MMASYLYSVETSLLADENLGCCLIAVVRELPRRCVSLLMGRWNRWVNAVFLSLLLTVSFVAVAMKVTSKQLILVIHHGLGRHLWDVPITLWTINEVNVLQTSFSYSL